jgi:DNA-binding beta-propeller fold protein YncE
MDSLISARRRRVLWGTTMAAFLVSVLWFTSPAPGRGQTVIATMPVGGAPVSVALNSTTNKIYVSNNGSSSVTVIDGATNSTTTVSSPDMQDLWGVAVNPVTNKIYVAN